MIVAFSTSSAQASVALIGPEGDLLASQSVHAPMQASGACLAILEALLAENGLRLDQATAFLADLGPGSFTGVKVAVTLAKTMAFAHGVQVGGANSFDLIDPDRTVVMPSKRGEFFIRRPGLPVERSQFLPEEHYVGFGPGVTPEVFPDAKRFVELIGRIEMMAPELLVPNYLIEPSISIPKNPLSPLGNAK